MNKLFNYIIGKSIKTKSFFDLSVKEKKRIVKKAAGESNKLQRDLINRVNRSVSL